MKRSDLVSITFRSTNTFLNTCLSFDCDGVLVDSEGISAKSLTISFAKLGVSLAQENLIERYRVIQFTKLVACFAEEYQVSLPDNFIPEYRNVVTKLIEKEVQPIEGVKMHLNN